MNSRQSWDEKCRAASKPNCDLRIFHFPFSIFHFSILLLLSAAANAQPPPETTTVSGTVMQSDGMSPAANAMVALRRTGAMMGSPAFWGATVTTNEYGRFEIPKVEEGHYQLTITHADYPPLVRLLNVRVNMMENLMFQLVPFSKISGTILCADGKQAAFRGNLILTLNRTDGNAADVITRFVTTDGQGRFQLDRIASGKYVVMAYAIGEGFGTSETLTVKEGEDCVGVTVRLQRHTPALAAADDASVRPATTMMRVTLPTDGASPPASAPVTTATPHPLVTTPSKPPANATETGAKEGRERTLCRSSTGGTFLVFATYPVLSYPPRATVTPPPPPSVSFTLRQSGPDGSEKRIAVGETSENVLPGWLARSSGDLLGRVVRKAGNGLRAVPEAFSVLSLSHALIFVTLEPLTGEDSASRRRFTLSPFRYALLTNEDGLFRLRYLPLGRYCVRVRTLSGSESVETVHVRPHPSLDPVTFFIPQSLVRPALDTTSRRN